MFCLHQTLKSFSILTRGTFLDIRQVAYFREGIKGKKKTGLHSRTLTPNGEETLYISVGSPKERKREGTSYPLKYPKHCRGNIEPLQMLSTLSPKKPKNMSGVFLKHTISLRKLRVLQSVPRAGNTLI